MITLRNDQLTFSFPQTCAQLRQLIENHVKTVLPRILAEDRHSAVQKLRNHWGYEAASCIEQSDAEQRVFSASAEEIGSALHRLSMAAVAGYDDCDLKMSFQRTLRIPDDGSVYPLPAGLGNFPLRDIDDFTQAVPDSWLEGGGVMMPMYQSEALWIHFSASYPFALKIGAGKINAVTGQTLGEGLSATPQNYVVVPGQPWLDGFAVSKGLIRQFVAMPLGAGYSAEEQITGRADAGGLQFQVFAMEAEAFFQNTLQEQLPKSLSDLLDELVNDIIPPYRRFGRQHLARLCGTSLCEEPAMGLGAGGKMQQEVYSDPYRLGDWDQTRGHRCFIHLCNSMQWRQITGTNPPHPPLTTSEYKRYGIPWFDYYRDDLQTLSGSSILERLESIGHLGKLKGEKPLAAEVSVQPELVVQFGNARRPKEVREWAPLGD
jgi:hypothetical protein